MRTEAARRGVRGFSSIVEEAVEQLLDRFIPSASLPGDLDEAEGAWTEEDVEEWERARQEAWATWQPNRSSTRTS